MISGNSGIAFVVFSVLRVNFTVRYPTSYRRVVESCARSSLASSAENSRPRSKRTCKKEAGWALPGLLVSLSMGFFWAVPSHKRSSRKSSITSWPSSATDIQLGDPMRRPSLIACEHYIGGWKTAQLFCTLALVLASAAISPSGLCSQQTRIWTRWL